MLLNSYFIALFINFHWTVARIGLKLDGVGVSGRRGPRMGRRRGRGRGSSDEKLKRETVSACRAHLRGHMPQICTNGHLISSL